MSCPHYQANRANPRGTVVLNPDEMETWQDRLLAEGQCPNRCGALVRIAPHVAACGCCGLEWRSP